MESSRSTRIAAAAVALLCSMWPVELAAQGRSPQALDGLRAVSVVVERATPATVAAGVDTAALRTRAEAVARQLGLRVLQPGARDSAAGVLYLNVFAASNPDGSWYAAHFEVEVLQPVTIDRKPDARLFATTWQAPARLRVVHARELSSEVRRVMDAMLDEFSREWSGANPGR